MLPILLTKKVLLKILNEAFTLKLASRLLVDKETIWAKIMKNKYFKDYELLNAPSPKPYHSSSTWKNIFKTC